MSTTPRNASTNWFPGGAFGFSFVEVRVLNAAEDTVFFVFGLRD